MIIVASLLVGVALVAVSLLAVLPFLRRRYSPAPRLPPKKDALLPPPSVEGYSAYSDSFKKSDYGYGRLGSIDAGTVPSTQGRRSLSYSGTSDPWDNPFNDRSERRSSMDMAVPLRPGVHHSSTYPPDLRSNLYDPFHPPFPITQRPQDQALRDAAYQARVGIPDPYRSALPSSIVRTSQSHSSLHSSK